MKSDFELMSILEGVKSNSYKDTEGNVTIGIGFNMDALDSKEIWDELDIIEDFALVYNGVVPISEESMIKLFDYFWTSSKIAASDRADSLGIKYDSLNEWHKFILADIAYNTGNVYGWTKVFKERSHDKVLFEARRKQKEIDSRIAKIGYYYGLIPSLEYAHEIGLTEARYLV